MKWKQKTLEEKVERLHKLVWFLFIGFFLQGLINFFNSLIDV